MKYEYAIFQCGPETPYYRKSLEEDMEIFSYHDYKMVYTGEVEADDVKEALDIIEKTFRADNRPGNIRRLYVSDVVRIAGKSYYYCDYRMIGSVPGNVKIDMTKYYEEIWADEENADPYWDPLSNIEEYYDIKLDPEWFD